MFDWVSGGVDGSDRRSFFPFIVGYICRTNAVTYQNYCLNQIEIISSTRFSVIIAYIRLAYN